MVPTLIVHNTSDLCHVSPSYGAGVVFKQLTQSSKKHLFLYENGDVSYGRDCGPTTPHGFLGIEKKAILDMTALMFKVLGKKKIDEATHECVPKKYKGC